MSENGKINIETLYLTIQRLEMKINCLQNKLDELTLVKQSTNSDWMTLKDLQYYLPNHPSESTIRRLISSQTIPSFRSGKRVLVKRSDIDDWLIHSKRMSVQETENTLETFVSTQKSSTLPPWRQKVRLNIPNAS